MDIEFHYYMTYLIAAKAGLEPGDALTLAYSSQYVDDNDMIFEIDNGKASYFQNYISQTMNILKPKQSLMRVYPIFHFIPGDPQSQSAWRKDGKMHWLNTTPNSDNANRVMDAAVRQAKFPAVKSLDSFDFKAIPSLNKMLVLELARGEYTDRHENVIALGNSGTGKTHVALGLGLAACQKGLSVGFITAATLVHELMEARDEKRLLRLQRQLAKYKLLIIDELGFVPLSKTGAELLFEVFSQRYERGSIMVTSNLPFDEWTEIFGSERLTGALLDRLTHHVHILEMNGESYRLNQSRKRRKSQKTPA